MRQYYITQFKSLKQQVEKEKQNLLALKQKTDTESSAIIHEFQIDDAHRRSQIMAEFKEHVQNIIEKWRAFLRFIDHERSPWGDPLAFRNLSFFLFGRI